MATVARHVAVTRLLPYHFTAALLCGAVLCSLGARQQAVFGAEEPSPATSSAEVQEPAAVDFYAAIQRGSIDVGVVAHSYSHLTMRIRNTGNQPLQIKLPETFAAVPARRVQLVQRMRSRGYNASLSNYPTQGGGNSQGVGGSLAGPWWDQSQSGHPVSDPEKGAAAGAAQQVGKSLLLAPGRFAQTDIPCFCLEYGKPDPEQKIAYVVRPLEELNATPAMHKLLTDFSNTATAMGKQQYVTQLAIWHLASGVPWKTLARVEFPRTQRQRGHRVKRAELLAAQQLSQAARLQAASLGKSD